MMGNAGTHAINAVLYKKLGYDPINDFAAISEIASIPLALVVHPLTRSGARSGKTRKIMPESGMQQQ